MALTSQQDIPKQKPQASEPWTFRRLFPKSAVDVLSKTFINPFDVILGYLIAVMGIIEVLGRHISYGYIAITFAILAVDLYERRKTPLPDVKKPNKKAK